MLLNDESGKVTAKLTSNVSASPLRNFEIDPQALIAAEKADRKGEARIAGYFHSHPNGRAEPSGCDADMAAADGRIWLIIARQTITGWRFEEDAGFSPAEIEIGN